MFQPRVLLNTIRRLSDCFYIWVTTRELLRQIRMRSAILLILSAMSLGGKTQHLAIPLTQTLR